MKVEQVLHAGRAGSGYIREHETPSSTGPRGPGRTPTGYGPAPPDGRHSEGFLVGTGVGGEQHLVGRLVRAREPGADDNRPGRGRQRQCHVAWVTDAAVRPVAPVGLGRFLPHSSTAKNCRRPACRRRVGVTAPHLKEGTSRRHDADPVRLPWQPPVCLDGCQITVRRPSSCRCGQRWEDEATSTRSFRPHIRASSTVDQLGAGDRSPVARVVVTQERPFSDWLDLARRAK